MRGAGICVQVRDVSDAVRFDEALAQRNEENASLREVARALAEEVDLAALLRLICQEATTQCRAAGATVGQITDDEVEVVAGTGLGDVARGVRFRLEGSSTARAIVARAPVRTQDYPTDFPDRAEQLKDFQIGPVLSAPLLAHDQVVGVLLVVRRVGAEPFTEAEERRVRAIADHAALAIWKSRLFEQAQDANRTKSEFMAVMSHELRTPLTALTGYEELLADEVLGPLSEQQLGAVERMRSSTELLTVIIDEILTFSRAEAGKEVVLELDTSQIKLFNPDGGRSLTAREGVAAGAAG
jgi:K+-sensing histidine kinase KdpD